MDLLWIIIAGSVILSIISAVSKNKKREEAQRTAQAGQRPMSDIQRAAMMAQETASQQPAAPQRPANAYTAQPNPMYAQQYSAPRQPYVPQQNAPFAPMQPRNAAPMEARTAAPMEARTAAPMEARTAAPMEARTAAPMEARTAAPQTRPASPFGEYVGSLGSLSSEGRADAMEGGKPAEVNRNLQTITDADLGSLSSLDGAKPLHTTAHAAPKHMPLNIFEGKNEYLKAVIYSEVLTRRTPGRRPGRA